MPAAGIFLATIAGILVVFLGPLELAFATVLATWLFVPGTLGMPGAPHVLLVTRLVLYAFAFRLLWRLGRPGEPSVTSLRPSRIHAALAVWLVVGYLDGVILAPSSVSFVADASEWLRLLDAAVVFVVTLAVARTIGAWRVARLVAGLVGATIVVAVIERITGAGWSHFLFEHLASQQASPGAAPLASRAGAVRVQVAAQFSLEYGWVLAFMLPLAFAMAVSLRRRASGYRRLTPILLPVALVAGILLTSSRSAEVAVIAAILGVVLLGGDRRVRIGVGVSAAAALVFLALDPGVVTAAFTAAARSNSISIRLARLPELFSLVSHRSVIGLGWRGYTSALPGLDNAYALLYASLGVLGLAAWGALLATILVSTWGSLRSPRGSDNRLLGVACVVGILLVGVAAGVYDLVVTPESTWALMILAGLGLAVAEAVPKRAHVAKTSRQMSALVALPIAGAAIGVVMLVLTPSHSARSYDVFTIAPWVPAVSHGPIDGYIGKVETDLACGLISSAARSTPSVSTSCQQLELIDPSAWPGEAQLRISGPDVSSVDSAARRGFELLRREVPGAVVVPTSPIQAGKPTWAGTAPLWLAITGLVLALLFPGLKVPSRRRFAKGRGQLRSPSPADGIAWGDRS